MCDEFEDCGIVEAPVTCIKKTKDERCRRCKCICNYYNVNCYRTYKCDQGPPGPPGGDVPIVLPSNRFSTGKGTCFIYEDKLYIVGQSNTIYGTSTDNNLTATVLNVVDPPSKWVKVLTLHTSIMALGSNGRVYMSGVNTNGELGNGTTGSPQYYMTPVRNDSDSGELIGICDIAAPSDSGESTLMAVHSSGLLYVWGLGTNGCLGNGTTPAAITLPTLVTYFNIQTNELAVKSVTIGNAGDNCHFAAITHGNTAVTWGDQSDGCLGNLIALSTPVPAPFAVFPELNCFKSAHISGNNIRFLLFDGTTMAAGANLVGELGNGNQTQNNVFEFSVESGSDVLIQNLTKVEMVGDTTYTVALDKSGKLWFCGTNSRGQAGSGATTDIINGFLEITHDQEICNFWVYGFNATTSFILFQDSTGKVYGSGSNLLGQLAIGNVTAEILTFTETLIDPRIAISSMQLYGTTNGTENNCGCAMISLEDGSAVGIGDPVAGQLGVWTDFSQIDIQPSPRSVIGFE